MTCPTASAPPSRAVEATDDETVFFSWIVYESREARDAVNAKVMADERMQADMRTCRSTPAG